MLGNRVERHPLAPGAVAGRVPPRSAPAENGEDVLDRLFAVGAARGRVLRADSPHPGDKPERFAKNADSLDGIQGTGL